MLDKIFMRRKLLKLDIKIIKRSPFFGQRCIELAILIECALKYIAKEYFFLVWSIRYFYV